MRQTLRTIGGGIAGAIPVLLLLLWWTWGIRSEYKWADLVIQQKSRDGWVVASKTDNFISLTKPWTWFKAPVSGVVFVNPKKLVVDVSGIVGADVMWTNYEDGKTKERTSESAFDCSKKQMAFLPENFKSGDDLTKLEWKSYEADQPGGKVTEFVCKSINESSMRTALALNEAEATQLTELLQHMDSDDYLDNNSQKVRDFFVTKTKTQGRQLTQNESNDLFESLRSRADAREQGSELALQSWQQNEVITTPPFDALIIRLQQRGGDDKNEADGMLFLINAAAEHKKIKTDGEDIDVNHKFLEFMKRSSLTYRQNVDAVIRIVEEFSDK